MFKTTSQNDGVKYSVLDLVKLLGCPYVHIPPREGEAKETLEDISNALVIIRLEPFSLIGLGSQATFPDIPGKLIYLF